MSPDDAEDSAENSLWADTADRRTATRALAEHRAEEHLSSAEHERRRELARNARTLGELRELFADLPAPHPLIGEAPATEAAWVARLARAGGGAGLLLATGGVIVLLAVVAGWWVPALIFGGVLAVATVLTTAAHR
jgi:hypothetical protein